MDIVPKDIALITLKFFNQQRKVNLIPFFLPLLFISLFTTLSFHRHLNLQSTMLDLGNMHQRVWTTLHGVFMHASQGRPVVEEGARFAIVGAFHRLLLIFVPIYAILASPLVVIFAQVFSVAAASFPIFLMAKGKLGNPFAGLVFQAMFFLYPQTHNVIMFDFHPMTFAMGFLSWAFYLLHKKTSALSMLFAVLVAFARELNALTVAAMGLYLTLFQKKLKSGAILTIGGIVYFLFIFQLLFPMFGITGVHPYFQYYEFERYTRYHPNQTKIRPR
jgi:uncharacterized membrane protein